MPDRRTTPASRDTARTHSGLLSSSTTATHDASSDAYAVGTAISGSNITLGAGHDLTTQSAQVSATQDIGLSAGHDVLLGAAQDSHSEEHDRSTTKRGGGLGVLVGTSKGDLFTRTHKVQQDSSSDTVAVGSVLSGDHVTVAAGHDLTTQVAQVAGTHDVVLAAGHDLTVGTADNIHTEDHSLAVNTYGAQRSGLHGMFGVAKSAQTASETDTTPTGSLIGSTDGAVTLSAGQDVHVSGSDVLSQTGTAIVGQNVTIEAAVGTADSHQTQSLHTGGIMAGLTGGAATAAEQAYASGQRAGQVSDNRLKALYAAQAAYGARDAYKGGSAGVGSAGSGGGAQGAANSSGVSLRIGIGASSTSAHSDTHDDISYASHIRSNGDVTLAATNGDLNVIGSQISGDNVALAASHDLNLLSQAEQHTQSDHNANARGELGISIGSQTGFYATADGGKGVAHGNGTSYANSSVTASDTLSLLAGNDATIEGAQAKGDTILADIGGNLSIASQQTTNDYASHSWQAGGTYVYGSGSEVHASAGMVDSNYTSVDQVSGIGAGSGGFQVHVGGHTDLTGAVIASTANPSLNLLDTDTLSFSDLKNSASYSVMSAGISVGSGSGGTSASPSIGVPQFGDRSSTTQAGIAQGTITVRNNPSTDLSHLDRAPDIDAAGLKPIFDQQKVAEQQELGNVAGQVGMRAAGDIASYMANHATTKEEQKSWQDGGANKVILHGLVGAVTAALGGSDAAQGALGAAGSEAASGAMQDYLRSQEHIDPNSPQGKTLMQLASVAIGAAAGGGSGGATALQGEQFNRQLHSDEIDWIKAHAKDFASQQCGCEPSAEQVDSAMKQLSQQAARQTDVLWAAALPGDDSAARQYLVGAQAAFTNNLGNAQKLFTVEGNQFLQPMMYLPDASANRGFYQQYVQPGTGNVNSGLQVMLAQAGVSAYLNQGQTVWNAATGAVTGIGEAILHPVDTFNGAGQDLGSNAAYVLNPGMVNSQLQAVYGQDVSSAATTLATLNTSLTLMAATGAGKGAAAAIEGAAKSAAVDAVAAAVRAGWKGDAAGLEQFTRNIVGSAGSVNRFLSADAVNATMDTHSWLPAWRSGTMVADATLKPGTMVNMVVDAKAYYAILQGDTSRAFGGWATFDNVSSQAYARNELAITEGMKSGDLYVIQVEVIQPINAQIGIVGAQEGAAGGGNQLHFNLPPNQRTSVFQYVQNSARGL